MDAKGNLGNIADMTKQTLENELTGEDAVRSERITEALGLLKSKGISQVQVASDLDISPQAITNWKKKGKIGKEGLLYLSENSGLSASYIQGAAALGAIPRNPRVNIEYNAGESGGAYETSPFVSVPMVESFYHGGNGDGLEHQDEPTFLKSLSFRRDWLEYMGFDITQLKVAMVHGQSMEPTLNEADVILVDKRQSDISTIENGAIYALVFKGKPLVKRVYKQELGGVALESDNKSFKDMDFSEEETKEIEFIGRVVWRGGEVS